MFKREGVPVLVSSALAAAMLASGACTIENTPVDGAGGAGGSSSSSTTFGQAFAIDLGYGSTCASCIDAMSGDCATTVSTCLDDGLCNGAGANSLLGCFTASRSTHPTLDPSCFGETCGQTDATSSATLTCIVDQCSSACGFLTNQRSPSDASCLGTGAGGAAGAAGAGGTAGTGGTDGTAGQGGVAGTGGTGGSSATVTYVRFAHVIPDYASAVDVCFRPCSDDNCLAGTFADATVSGPIFSQSGFPTVLSRGIVSSYFQADAATYQVRLVPASSAGCTNPLPGSSDAILALGAEGTHLTVLAWGTAAVPSISSYVSDALVSGDGLVHYRFINALGAAADQTLDFGTYDPLNQNTFTALATNVVSRSDAEPVSLGSAEPSSNTGFAAVDTGTAVTAVGSSATFQTQASQSYDLFAFGNGGTDNQLLLCLDDPSDVVSSASLVSGFCVTGAGQKL